MEAPRPTPRHRGASDSSIPLSQVADLRERPKTQPIPRPRYHTTSGGHGDSLAEEEDIYTDNSPLTTDTPPRSRRVAWADSGSHGYSPTSEGPPQSIGFAPISTPTGPVGGNKEQALSPRELTLNQREAELRRLADRLEAQRSDQEFALAERERKVQHREDSVHIREKDVKHREFDLENSDIPHLPTGGKQAELVEKEMALDNRTRDLVMRERWLEEQSQRLNAWEAKLKEREFEVSRREAEVDRVRSPGYPQYAQPYQQGFPPQGGQYYPPQSYTPPPPGQQRGYAYTQPQAAQPTPPQQYAPQIPPSVAAPIQSPPVQLPPTIVPIATNQPPPAAIRQEKVSVDLELATMLQHGLAVGARAQIDEDAEMARRLQEEEDREHRRKVEMDTQLALKMQGDELTITDDLTQGGGQSSSAQEAIQKRLEEELAHKREMEEQSRRLAQELEQGEAEPIPSRNDLNS